MFCKESVFLSDFIPVNCTVHTGDFNLPDIRVGKMVLAVLN